MATISSSFLIFHTPCLHQQTIATQLTNNPRKNYRKTFKRGSLTINSAQSDIRKEEIVIVGAGIAGLATAVSLNKLGVGSLVLEQAETLRTGGTSLTLFKNGWKILDEMGVGDELRSQYFEVQGMEMKTDSERVLRSFEFKEDDPTQEVRTVERGILLETLAKKLPADSISYSSKLAKIEKHENGETLLELANGTKISSKVVIGCDGVRSSVAKWMGFSEPNYVGYCAFRGLADYPNGQPYVRRVTYIYGQGVRAGFAPASKTKVYWFVIFNSPEPGPRITDPLVLKNQTKELIKKWPSELQNIIDATPDDTIIRTPIADRWLWPGLSPRASSGGVVLVGDAWHPMTPNLGQGACSALEDALILVEKLAPALKAGPTVIENAMRSYENERWSRIFSITIKANLFGAVLQSENPVVCAIRDNVLVPKLVRLGTMLEHTNFEFEPLLQTKI
ncbi:monooxygenase 2-like [Rutidosis leptorrhynchoides]|uniref:monooxygenase 2-like n=1 Tax=Rutidosis leptorrhynchoides TaxID=125765 RepID=UPI003A993841